MAMARLLGNSLLNVVNHGGGGPVIAWVPAKDLAVGSDDRGGKRVGQGVVAARAHAHIKKLLHRIQFRGWWRGKVPVRKRRTAGVCAAVAVQYLWRVIRRIEADTEKMSCAGELGIGGKLLLDGGKIAAYADAVIRKVTSRVNKGDQQNFAPKLVDIDGLAALIEKFEVGDRLPGCGDVIGLGWLVVRLGLRNHIDLINHASEV